MWRRSITLHLTLLFSGASMLVLLVIGAVIGITVENHFEEQDLSLLDGKLELVGHILEKVYTPADLDAFPQKMADALVGHTGLAISVMSSDGRRIFATRGVDFPAQLTSIPAHAAAALGPLIWERERHRYRGIAARVPGLLSGVSNYVVAVVIDITHHRDFMAAFYKTLWLSIGFGVFVSGVLGWFAAHRGLIPVRNISDVATRISAHHLTERLRIDTLPSELIDLAQSLNGMLARLEDAFKRLSDFSSDLAHELRAPVSNLMTQTQVALSKPRGNEEYREVLSSNSEEYERLSRMISEMLFLAQADHGLIAPRYEPVDLATEVDRLIDFYEAYAEERSVTLRRNGAGKIYSDRLMIQRGLGNLLSNAIRHTPHSGVVTVTVKQREHDIAIIVENPGAQIPAAHLPYLFDRFYRVDPSRERSSEGAGLGLAITQSIIETLGGAIAVDSARDKTQFIVTLSTAGNGESRDDATAKPR